MILVVVVARFEENPIVIVKWTHDQEERKKTIT